MIFIEIIYLVSVILLATYGINALILASIRKWRHKPVQELQTEQDYYWPQVTVHLPVFNERYVVERLLDSIEQLDYPRERLYIQVLDDSTDNTREIIAQSVARLKAKGFDIDYIHRIERIGYKGGALENGLKYAKGEYIAIFDADFIPPPGFLKGTLLYFELDDDNNVGCIQTRWGHTNRDYSWLTRTQANGIDGHFIIEQETRSEKNLFLNFNGTAGVWRKSCILDSGGWQHDTLTEDLELSYRAQLRGWKIRYLPHIITPAELPVHINALKRQQFRWAKGSIQTARKLLVGLWRSRNPLTAKIEGTLHLTHYLVHPLMLLNLLLMLPLLRGESPLLRIYPIFIIGALGPLFMYMVAMGGQSNSIIERIKNLAMLVLLGMGLSLNNTRAVTEALIGKQSAFKRTPKFNLDGRIVGRKYSDYLLPRDGSSWLEILLAIYAFSLLVYALFNGVWGLLVWLVLYSGGYTYVAGLNILQSLGQMKPEIRSTRQSEPDTLAG